MTSPVDQPDIAQDALQRHDWEDAYRELSQAGGIEETPLVGLR